MEYIIAACLLLIIFLLWRNGSEGRCVSGHSNDWLILLWYKDQNILDKDIKVKSFNVDETINIQFIPIIGWRYSHWSGMHGNLNPITPSAYQVKDRLQWDDGYIRTSYWIRDGKQYDISPEWTSENDFWKDLADWVESNQEIKIHGNMPDSLQDKVRKIIDTRTPG